MSHATLKNCVASFLFSLNEQATKEKKQKKVAEKNFVTFDSKLRRIKTNKDLQLDI